MTDNFMPTDPTDDGVASFSSTGPMASADSAMNKNGNAAYTVFQQGAGRVNAYAAVYNQSSGSANRGLNVVDANGNAVDTEGIHWNKSYAKSQGCLWNNGCLWNQSAVAPASASAAMESWNSQE